MRRFTVAVVLSLALGAVPTSVLAQAKPTTPPAAQQPAPPRPFPEGAKIAYINIPRIAAESAEGKASTAKASALLEKKLGELNAKNTQLEAAQKKLNSGSLLSEEARAAAQKETEKLNVEIQRMQQDAEAEFNDLQQQLQLDFQRKLSPIIQQIATEKGLHILLSQTDAGMVWWDPGLDLTREIIKRFDAASAAAAKTPGK